MPNRGIYLTQPTTTRSVWGCGRGLSQDADGTRTSLLHRGSVQTLSVWPSLARGICLPSLRWQNGLANVPRALAVRRLPAPGFGYSRNDLSGQPLAAHHLVSGDVARHQPEEWSERLGVAASPGAWQLQNGLGHVAQAAASDGASRSGSVARSR